MTLIEDAEKWAWQVAVKKVMAGVIGFLASQKAVAGIAWLQAHGVTINVDTARFQNEMTAVGIGGFVAFHDYLKLHYPNSRWL